MNEKNLRKGYIEVFLGYVIWGILAIYWKQIHYLTPLEILSVRIIFSVVTLLIVVFVMKKPQFIRYFRDKKIRRRLYLSALFISVNWGVFVYAVGTGQVLQASLGYFINPLFSIFLGVLILREKLEKLQYISLAFAAIGVLYLTFGYGQFPWISITVAFSFGMYGLLKKIFKLDTLNSLLMEVVILLPFAIVALLYQSFISTSSIGEASASDWVFIILSGVVTVIPLVLFGNGAKRIPLSAVGFLQYITPTMMLLISVILYEEVFTRDHLISFSLIWFGLSIYTVTIFRKSRGV